MSSTVTERSAQPQDDALEETWREFSTVILRLTRRQMLRERCAPAPGRKGGWPVNDETGERSDQPQEPREVSDG